MTAEQLEKLLGMVTQGEWRTTFRHKGVIADHNTGYDDEENVSAYGGHLICESVAWESNADLIALAPSLARRVIAAEKLVEALDRIRTLNTIDVDDNGDTWVHSGLIEQEVWVAKCAYREASK